MTFSLADQWIWDFWIAEEEGVYHLFHLRAPRSLGDPALRHRNATIGHATSPDLHTWTDHGTVIGPGSVVDADASATWTGSVLRGTDGWVMAYTGSRFLAANRDTNIESIVFADSEDLHEWRPRPSSVLTADPRWYEQLEDGTWREQAWRDPWLIEDPGGDGWRMLVTARARHGADEEDRGVIGCAASPDLTNWRVLEPLTAPGSGFAHLEVVQWAEIDGRSVVIFSCDSAHLVGRRRGGIGGVWAVAVDGWGAPIDLDEAVLLVDESLYAGRAVRLPDGAWALIAFLNSDDGGRFGGGISDPVPLRWDDAGRLVAESREVAL